MAGGRKKGKSEKGAKSGRADQRKVLRRLESRLADAATRELRQLRKFEKARLRSQRIEAEIDGLQPSDAAAPAAADGPKPGS